MLPKPKTMLRTALIFTFLLQSLLLSAQTDTGMCYIAVKSGYQLSLKNFNSVDGAKNGYSGSLESAHYFSRHFGLVFSLSYNYFYVNPTLLASSYKQIPDVSWKISSTNWRYSSYVVGLIYGYRFKKLIAEARIMPGFVNLQSPETYAQAFSNGTAVTDEYHENSDLSGGYAISGGIGLRYLIRRTFYAGISVDRFHSSVDITSRRNGKVVKYGETMYVNWGDAQKHKIDVLTAGFSVGYAF